MDKLEKYILDHQEEFNTEIPSEDLINKIKFNTTPVKKLDFWSKNKNKILRYTGQIAAAVLIFFIARYTVPENKTNNTNEQKQLAESFISPELQKVEEVYGTKVNKMLTRVNQYSNSFPDINQQVNIDMAELDSIYNSLKNDLKDNIDNKEVIEAMILNYKLKLEVLEEILFTLQMMEPEKENQNNYTNADNTTSI